MSLKLFDFKDYEPRNDVVLLRFVQLDRIIGSDKLAAPQSSDSGKLNVVVKVGPKVEGLKPGDVVGVAGQIGVDVGRLPGTSEYGVTRQDNVMIVKGRMD